MISPIITPQAAGLVDWRNPISRHPLNDGLVAWYLAGAPGFRSGTWRDLCGKHHGTLTNMTPSTAWQATSRPGGWGALDFDYTTTNHVNVGSGLSAHNGSFTAVAWVKSAVLSGDVGGNNRTIYCKNSSVGNWGFELYQDWSGGIDYWQASVVTTSPLAQYNVQTTALVDRNWRHVGAVFDNTAAELRLYVDGKWRATTATGTGPRASSNAGYIGQDRSGNNRYDGLISDLRAYTRALPDSEMLALYNLSRQHYPGLLNRVELPWYAAAPAGGFIDNTSPILRHVMGAC